MNEFERLRELIKDNPGVPVVLKIKGMPEKNFDCRYYITEGFVHGDKLLTEEEMEVELFNEWRDDEVNAKIDDYDLNDIVDKTLSVTDSARIIAVEIW